MAKPPHGQIPKWYDQDSENYDTFNEGTINSKTTNTTIELSIDWVRATGDTKLRDVQHSVIDERGILVSYTTHYLQKGSRKTEVSQSIATLQLYTAQDLKDMLARNGFRVLRQCGMDGSSFSQKNTERILTIARKQ